MGVARSRCFGVDSLDQSQDVPIAASFVGHLVDEMANQVYTEAPDRPLLNGLARIRRRDGQRIERSSVV